MSHFLLRARIVLAVACAALASCGGDVTKEPGAGGSAAGGSGTGAQGATGTGASGTAGSGGAACGDCAGFACCDGACVNTDNDVANCGTCNAPCAGANPYCNHGICGTPPCAPDLDCGPNAFCCDASCCAPGQLCCTVPGPVGETTSCAEPTADGTCPKGCVECKCAAPDTPIATPDGERPIAALRVGDLVYSVDGGALRAVPVVQVHQQPAEHHAVMRVVLADGAVLEMSPRHPTADGRTFGALRAGDRLDGAVVVSSTLVDYRFDRTFDVLPASDTGTYVAAGVLVGSTLRGE